MLLTIETTFLSLCLIVNSYKLFFDSQKKFSIILRNTILLPVTGNALLESAEGKTDNALLESAEGKTDNALLESAEGETKVCDLTGHQTPHLLSRWATNCIMQPGYLLGMNFSTNKTSPCTG